MSIAPFVPSATLASLPRGNLLLQSNTFTNASWTKTACTATGGQTDPNGGSTATLLTEDNTNSIHRFNQTVTTGGGYYALSAWIEASGRNWAFLAMGGVQAWFDLVNGVVGKVTGGTSSISGPVGGFYRCCMTVNLAAGASIMQIATALSNGSTAFTGSNLAALTVWDAVVEPTGGSSGGGLPGTYVPTTTSTDPGIWAGTQGLPVLPFLPGQMISVSKAPVWSTERITSASGRVRKTSYWPNPKWQFELQYEVIRHKPTNDELFTMWEFFNVAKGQFGTWLFVDPTDCQITTAFQFGTGDGVTTAFQLTRPINSFVEPVYDVYQPTILDNGGAAGAYTMGPNGVVTFSVAPTNAHALTWLGYFYFGCEFMQDDLTFAQIVNLLWSGKSLKFMSVPA